MMLTRYVALADDFTLKHSESVSNLYCLRTGSIYELQPDQVDFLQLLDGTRALENLVRQYSDESQPKISSFLKDLRNISAVRFTDTPQPRTLQMKKVPDDRLESVHLEASSACNMSCAHCYQAKYIETGVSLAHEQIIRLLDDLADMQINNIGVSGGEPLMIFRLPEILMAIEERDIRIGALFTNGTLINNKTVEMIACLKSRFPVLVSLDSPPGGEYAFRGFEQERAARRILNLIVRNVGRLVKEKIPVVINTMVNNENIEYLSDMYDTLQAMGVSGWRLGFPKPTGQFQITESTFGASWPRIKQAYLALLRKHFERKMPLELQIEYVFRKQLLERGIPQLKASDFVCDYEERRSGCCVKPNGDVVSCPYCSELPMGNILVSPIRDIWYSTRMKRTKRIRIKDVDSCKGCDLIGLCGTGCRANAFFLHDDFIRGKDDHACIAVEFFYSEVMPLFKEYGLTN